MSDIRARMVLFAVGSPLAIDAEETCARAGIDVLACIRNVDGPLHVTDAMRVLSRDAVTDAERACRFVVPLFTPGHRRAAVLDALQAGFTMGATLVDPTSPVARSAVLAQGVYVNAGSVVGGLAQFDEWALVNRGVNVGHHVRIGAYASIGPGVTVGGLATIGRGAVIAAGSVILPGVSIGDNAVVAAGTVVRDDVAARTLVAGQPMRVVRTSIAGYKDLCV